MNPTDRINQPKEELNKSKGIALLNKSRLENIGPTQDTQGINASQIPLTGPDSPLKENIPDVDVDVSPTGLEDPLIDKSEPKYFYTFSKSKILKLFQVRISSLPLSSQSSPHRIHLS